MLTDANLRWLAEGCWGVRGTCAIYVGNPSLIAANEVDLRHLCPLIQPVAELQTTPEEIDRCALSVELNLCFVFKCFPVLE